MISEHEQMEEAESRFHMFGRVMFIVLCVIIVLLLVTIGKAHAEEYTDNQIVEAIGKAENSVKYPYGIRSVKCESVKECRQICLNSVRNAKKRWSKAGKPEDLIVFMGRRYSPPATNPNWVRLVKYFLNKGAV